VYGALADAVVATHFAFLAFVLFGGFAAVHWRWLRWPHVAAVGWALAIVVVPGLLCPLTVAENWARRRAGHTSYSGGFIDRYVEGVIYPARFTPLVQVVVVLLVLTSWLLWWRVRPRAARPDVGT
jgi:hypothetical protein